MRYNGKGDASYGGTPFLLARAEPAGTAAAESLPSRRTGTGRAGSGRRNRARPDGRTESDRRDVGAVPPEARAAVVTGHLRRPGALPDEQFDAPLAGRRIGIELRFVVDQAPRPSAVLISPPLSFCPIAKSAGKPVRR